MKETIPVVGKIYHYFDDGRIKVSKRSEVLITDVIPFEKIDKETLKKWKIGVPIFEFYARKTDFFIKADLKFEEGIIKKITFVRTVDNGWFSIGYYGGRLDIDGSLNDTLKEKDKEFQQGLVDKLNKDLGFNDASIYTILLALVQDSSIEEVSMLLEEVKKDWKKD
jgi:hypothetical protein